MNRWGPFSFLVCLSLVTLLAGARSTRADDTGDMPGVRLSADFSREALQFSTRHGYDVVDIAGAYPLGQVGGPSLPYAKRMVALPAGMEATGIRILGVVEEEITGSYVIFPSQPALQVGRTADESPFVPPDGRSYGSYETIPAQVVELAGQADLAGQGIAVLHVYPVRYVPAEKRLTLLTSIDFVVEGRGGYLCGDYLPGNMSVSGKTAYERKIREMVSNPDDVELHSSDGTRRTTGVEPGDYDYVIITESGWMDDFQPLADWKTKKGTPASIVDRDWIYSEYGGSTNQAKIRAFVQDAHSTWGAIYFLLGGDTNTIPYYTYSNSVGSVPSDTYYGDYDSDWICEVHVGRASVRTTSAIDIFIDKALTYETNPPLSSYAKRAGLFGFDLYTYGSNEGEGCKQDIDNLYIPSGWDVTKVYDSHAGNHETNTIAAINAGQNLLNHVDHSGTDFMGTGYTNHWWGLYNSDMDNLYNGDKQGIFYSIGCDPCAIDYDCIAEHYVRDDNGGGVAFVGNTRYGWYSAYDYDTYSLHFDQCFFRSLFSQGRYRLGECFSDHKDDAYINDDYFRYIYHELTLLGDPELPIWTENPMGFDTVTYPDSIPIGSQDVTVTVEDGGSPVPGAVVCLMKEAEVYEVGTTGPGGSVTLNVNPSSIGSIDVTVTGRNYLPFEGSFVVAGEAPDVAVTLVPDSTVAVRGERFGYEVTVTNNSGFSVTIDYWSDLILWNGNPYGGNPLFGPITGTIDPSQTVQGHIYHAVPPNAPLEIYTLYGRIGGYPGAVWAEDRFDFTIVDPGATAGEISDWEVAVEWALPGRPPERFVIDR